jgi:hypothetical protein
MRVISAVTAPRARTSVITPHSSIPLWSRAEDDVHGPRLPATIPAHAHSDPMRLGPKRSGMREGIVRVDGG